MLRHRRPAVETLPLRRSAVIAVIGLIVGGFGFYRWRVNLQVHLDAIVQLEAERLTAEVARLRLGIVSKDEAPAAELPDKRAE